MLMGAPNVSRYGRSHAAQRTKRAPLTVKPRVELRCARKITGLELEAGRRCIHGWRVMTWNLHRTGIEQRNGSLAPFVHGDDEELAIVFEQVIASAMLERIKKRN
jgi:hypothetical protein